MNLIRYISIALCSLSLSAHGADQLQIPEGAKGLVEEIQRSIPNLEVQAVSKIPVPGMFAVDIAGGETLYGSADGRFLFTGDLYQLKGGLLNLAEQRRAIKRKALLDAQPMEAMVVFSPKEATKTYVTVFTDVDCGYCRKLHQEMEQINEFGIEVRYLAYPRQGLGTPTSDKIVSAWCSDDPNGAITALKAGQSIPSKQCDNPVAAQYDLGRQIGITGTPSIVTADGRLIGGYVPAQQLAEAVGLATQ